MLMVPWKVTEQTTWPIIAQGTHKILRIDLVWKVTLLRKKCRDLYYGLGKHCAVDIQTYERLACILNMDMPSDS
jgi:hypothetical protein